MSIVGSFISASTTIRINPKLGIFMDNLLAIGCGLTIRVILDAVSHSDDKLTGTLVGLWEGVVMLHFLKKMPYSFDPYVAYGVRLFVDFLVTESVSRLMLVLLWTGMGMILADIGPALWSDTGLKRIWRRFRRDVTYVSRSMPAFTKPRTVRFLPSRRSRASSAVTSSVISTSTPSVVSRATTQTQPNINVLPPTPERQVERRRASSRPIPGAFDAETETDVGSTVDIASVDTPGLGTTRGFLWRDMPTDDGLSSSESSTTTEIPDPSSVDDMPEIMVEEEKNKTVTPKQSLFPLPPTPADSAAQETRNERVDTPAASEVPNIPDNIDAGGDITDDWENIEPPPVPSKEPTPPAFEVGPSTPKALFTIAPSLKAESNAAKSTSREPSVVSNARSKGKSKAASSVGKAPSVKSIAMGSTRADDDGVAPEDSISLIGTEPPKKTTPVPTLLDFSNTPPASPLVKSLSPTPVSEVKLNTNNTPPDSPVIKPPSPKPPSPKPTSDILIPDDPLSSKDSIIQPDILSEVLPMSRNAEVPKEKEASPPSPTESTSSVIATAPGPRLAELLSFLKQLDAKKRELVELKQDEAKVGEAANIEKDIEELAKKTDRRRVPVTSGADNKIDISTGVSKDKILNVVEERLLGILSANGTFLEITYSKGKANNATRARKTQIMTGMQEYDLNVTDEGKVLTVLLPSLS